MHHSFIVWGDFYALNLVLQSPLVSRSRSAIKLTCSNNLCIQMKYNLHPNFINWITTYDDPRHGLDHYKIYSLFRQIIHLLPCESSWTPKTQPSFWCSTWPSADTGNYTVSQLCWTIFFQIWIEYQELNQTTP